MHPSANDRINLEKNTERVRILYGDTVIADTRGAVELRETGYPPRQYLPRKDVNIDYLQHSRTVTHCPFKGDAAWYHVVSDDNEIRDAAWSYEDPFEAMEDIRAYLAFDSSLLTEIIGDQ